MNDLISKASVCEILADIYPTDGEKVVAVKKVDEAYEAILQLPYEQPEQRWTPVSEGLPEKTDRYLITYCYQDEIETQEAVYVEGEEDKWYDTTDIEITLAVIAWKPLPEPYQSKQKGADK